MAHWLHNRDKGSQGGFPKNERETKRNGMNTQAFILAGNATFTATSLKTLERVTFQVQKSKDKDFWFVRSLFGPNNETDFRYIGFIGSSGKFLAGNKGNPNHKHFQVFDWIWNKGKLTNSLLKINHEGKCGRCGRKLTVPESIESGFGPECSTKL